MTQRDKVRSEEKSKARAEKKAEKKAENEKLYQEVMSEFEEEIPDAPEKPKSKNKLLKRIGIILFVLLNAAVIYFTASSEFSKKAPPPIKFSFTNILFLLGGILCLIVVLGSETLKYMIMMRHLGEKVSFRHAFSTAALGKYYDCITPSGATASPPRARAASPSRSTISTVRATAAERRRLCR